MSAEVVAHERCNSVLYGLYCKKLAGHRDVHSDGYGNHWLALTLDADVVKMLDLLGEFIAAGGTAGTGTLGERLVQGYRDYLTRH